MILDQKVLTLPNVCGIHIDAQASILPAANGAMQPFYYTHINQSEATPVYFGRRSVSFSETGTESRSGISYTQEVKLRFPDNDPLRAERISRYVKVKFLYVTFSGNQILFIGRNDYFQNTDPVISTSSNGVVTEVTYRTRSMFPAGFTNGNQVLTGQFPISFIP